MRMRPGPARLRSYDHRMPASRRTPRFSALPACALVAALALAPQPGHALWGALAKIGKAAGGAGKAAGTAGKGAAVGVAGAEGVAELAGRGAASAAGGLADDAARTGLKAGGELSAVNAALPPEVAAYLARPARKLTPKDTSAMMDTYRRMVERAGRTGDFTAVERIGTGPGPGRVLDPAPPARAGAAAAPAAPSSAGTLPFEAVRLLAHAASAGHRGARQELEKVCTPGTPEANRFRTQLRQDTAFRQLCADRPQRAATR